MVSGSFNPILKTNFNLTLVTYCKKSHLILNIRPWFICMLSGNLCMITGGHNLGRVGTITHRERHPGSFDIVHVKDALGHTFATRYVLKSLGSCWSLGCLIFPTLKFLCSPGVSLINLTMLNYCEFF